MRACACDASSERAYQNGIRIQCNDKSLPSTLRQSRPTPDLSFRTVVSKRLAAVTRIVKVAKSRINGNEQDQSNTLLGCPTINNKNRTIFSPASTASQKAPMTQEAIVGTPTASEERE